MQHDLDSMIEVAPDMSGVHNRMKSEGFSCTHTGSVRIESAPSILSEPDGTNRKRHILLVAKCELCGNPVMFSHPDIGLSSGHVTVSPDRMTLIVPFKFLNEVFDPMFLTAERS